MCVYMYICFVCVYLYSQQSDMIEKMGPPPSMFKFMGNMMINAYGEAANSEIYIIRNHGESRQ